ncbi:hypothetical protein BDY17DRAFT_325296 [Neohortaea acidophila]|uniref:Required for respiratory growth protein 8, mitochondrial n=1 Tax=Neohortaea acidophila TaxID=245834 RepID=A0A6A6PP42_9PEZI|nr:uncharacterized protein BDY17DRAFT_325296 [Neohortaea acidophila]KAF2481782.1 hypothetical protein BDY17DRAFT_325296 [Neohortaea acidophila]
MDPIVLAAREKYTQPKAVVVQEELTEFQRELAKNPFAQSLASPIRQCSLTRVRLPTHFLQPFSTVVSSTRFAPEGDKRPHLLPHPARTRHEAYVSTGSSSYVINRRHVLDYLNRKGKWTAAVSFRMQEGYAKVGVKKRAKVGDTWVWDREMPERILGDLRAEVVKRLEECCGMTEEGKKLDLIVSLDTVADRRGITPAALLRVESTAAPLALAVVNPWLPVYDLPTLLGPAIFSSSTLSKRHPASPTLAIFQHPSTISLLLALDRLATYTRAPTTRANGLGQPAIFSL